MRIAILSDVHGNLTALEAVLDDIARVEADQMVCLGDLAFKGPQPEACVARIRELGIPCIHGNTDLALLQFAGPPQPDLDEVPPAIAARFRWPAERLSAESLCYLADLPFSHRLEADGQQILFVHASPQDVVSGILPTMAADQIRPLLQGEQADWIVFGHTHQAFAFRFEGCWLANPGAVGFSLDGDGRAAYAILDTARSSIELRRVSYDVDAAVAAAREQEFCFDPDRYGEALRAGTWPPDL